MRLNNTARLQQIIIDRTYEFVKKIRPGEYIHFWHLIPDPRNLSIKFQQLPQNYESLQQTLQLFFAFLVQFSLYIRLTLLYTEAAHQFNGSLGYYTGPTITTTLQHIKSGRYRPIQWTCWLYTTIPLQFGLIGHHTELQCNVISSFSYSAKPGNSSLFI